MTTFPTGKLPNEHLARLLERFGTDDPRVVVGPAVGADVALIDMHGTLLAAKTDPVTFATDRIGWYAVHVNANDIACSGAEPRWFLATLLLPESGTTERLIDEIMEQISAACAEVGATLCGGHTEITHGLDRPIVVGQMLGEVAPEDALTTANAKVGDTLLLTKGIAVEGTSIIAREFASRLDEVPEATLERAKALLDAPGISVVEDARVVRAAGGVHALHDPTEGGLSQALYELATAADVGVVVRALDIPVLPECEALCRPFGVDPLGLISSGALLVSAEPKAAQAMLEALAAAGIEASIIGEVVDAREGVRRQLTDGRTEAFPTFARDELARLLDAV